MADQSPFFPLDHGVVDSESLFGHEREPLTLPNRPLSNPAEDLDGASDVDSASEASSEDDFALRVQSFAMHYQKFVGYPVAEQLFWKYAASAMKKQDSKPSLWSYPLTKTILMGAGSIAATLAIGIMLSENSDSQPTFTYRTAPASSQISPATQPSPSPYRPTIGHPNSLLPGSVEFSNTNSLSPSTTHQLPEVTIPYTSARFPTRSLLTEPLVRLGEPPNLSPNYSAYANAIANRTTSQPVQPLSTQGLASIANSQARVTIDPNQHPAAIANSDAGERQINAELAPEIATSQPTNVSRPEATTANLIPGNASSNIPSNTIPSNSSSRPPGTNSEQTNSPNSIAADVGVAATQPTLATPTPQASQSDEPIQAGHQAFHALARQSGLEINSAVRLSPYQMVRSDGRMETAPNQAESPLSAVPENVDGTRSPADERAIAPDLDAVKYPEMVSTKLEESLIGIQYFLTLAHQVTDSHSQALLPLTNQAAREAGELNQIPNFRVFRLSDSDYQQAWAFVSTNAVNPVEHADHQADSPIVPNYGFIDYQRQIIVLPVPSAS